MSRKTKFNLLAGIGVISLILLAILGPRINITIGTQPAQAQPAGCVAMPVKGITGGYMLKNNICSGSWGSTANCITGACQNAFSIWDVNAGHSVIFCHN